MILYETTPLVELYSSCGWVCNHELVTTSCSIQLCQTLEQALTTSEFGIAAAAYFDCVAVNVTRSIAWQTSQGYSLGHDIGPAADNHIVVVPNKPTAP